MKKIKRDFLTNTKWIQFKKKYNYLVTLYYEPSKLTGVDKQFYLYLDITYKRTIKGLKITAVYIDTTKEIKDYEAVEVTDDIFIRTDITDGMYNCTERILIKSGNYILWKLIFQSTNGEETNLAFHADTD